MSNSGSVIFRAPDYVFSGFIVSMILAALVIGVPNYDRLVYKSADPVEYGDDDYIGFPADDDISVLDSRREIEREEDFFTIEVDAKVIEPLDVYLYNDGSVGNSSFMRALNGLGLDEDEMAARYFVVDLEHGGDIVVLLDDHAVKIPRWGTVTLPAGELRELDSKARRYIEDTGKLDDDDLEYYVDMASDWMDSPMGFSKAMRFKIAFGAATWFMTFPLLSVLFYLVERKEKQIASETVDEAEAKRQRILAQKRKEREQDEG